MNDTMKTYWFVFYQNELLLEKHPDGTYSVPHQEEPPTATHPWTRIHHISPALADGEVNTYQMATPDM